MVRHFTVALVTLVLLTSCGGSAENPSSTAPAPFASPGTTVSLASPAAAATATLVATALPTATVSATVVLSPTARPLIVPSPSGSGTPPGIRGGDPAIPTVAPAATLSPDPRVTARLARDVTSDFKPIDETTIFAPDSAKIHLVFTTKGLAPGTRLVSVWIAEKVDADVPPNFEIDRASINVERDGDGDFSLSRPDNGFPIGSYRAELYREETLIGVFRFMVVGR